MSEQRVTRSYVGDLDVVVVVVRRRRRRRERERVTRSNGVL